MFALDQQGRELWHHVFPEGLGLYPADEIQLRNLYATADLDGDGHNELILIQLPPPLTRSSKGSKIACFRGGELVKTLAPGRPLVLGPDSKGDRYTRPYGPKKSWSYPARRIRKLQSFRFTTKMHHARC